MKHKLVKMNICDYEDAREYERILNGWTAQGYKVLSCGVTDFGRFAWAVMQMDDAEREATEWEG